jgi:peptide/nickel transport system substrate-binding protein
MRKMLKGTLLATAILCAFWIAGVGQTDFTLLLNSEPPLIDPATAASNPEIEICRAVYETLLNVDPDTTEAIPVLATSWEKNSDSTEWTFHLRANVKFHGGATFAAQDVKTAVEREVAIGKGESYVLGNIVEVVVVDDLTVKFILGVSEPEFYLALARFYIPSSATIAAQEKDGDLAQAWFAENADGTGAYEFVNWERRQRLVCERFDAYWGGWDGQHVDRLLFTYVPEPGTQLLMMKQGEGNFADSVLIEDAVKLEDDPSGLSVFIGAGNPMYMPMNTAKGPLSNPLVREAITHAFDYDTYLDAVTFGYAPRLVGVVPGNTWGANTDLAGVDFDLDKSKELLAQAGYPDGGFTIDFIYLETWLFERTAALLLQETLRPLGIDMTIAGYPWATYTALMGNAETRPDMGFMAVFPGGTPDSLLRVMYHSESDGHWAYWGYENPAFDNTLDAAVAENDDEFRRTLYQIAQDIVYNDYAAIYVMQQAEVFVFSPDVRGFKYNPHFGNTLNYYGLYLEN